MHPYDLRIRNFIQNVIDNVSMIVIYEVVLINKDRESVVAEKFIEWISDLFVKYDGNTSSYDSIKKRFSSWSVAWRLK